MTTILVDGLTFTFPDEWHASKYDEWGFYRNQFQKVAGGMKAVDLLAKDPLGTVWFIEVKDYSLHPRTKATDLHEEIARKTADTMAGLLPTKLNATSTEEREMAGRFLKAKKLRVVLHIELPATHSSLWPKGLNPANVKQKLKAAVKAIDAHPMVVDSGNLDALAWQVA